MKKILFGLIAGLLLVGGNLFAAELEIHSSGSETYKEPLALSRDVYDVKTHFVISDGNFGIWQNMDHNYNLDDSTLPTWILVMRSNEDNFEIMRAPEGACPFSC